ncbi:MAG TPA: phosphatase PAP2 family protein [Lachnospiraceae bacterium]|nr:phosphatase PAP2 family protein [Lachnospiraceae bacterium]
MKNLLKAAGTKSNPFSLKEFLSSYRFGLIIPLYAAIYLPWFCYLEEKVTKRYHIIHMAIDDYIPFCEVFIIPYFLWFVYMTVSIVLCMVTNKESFFRSFFFLSCGMTIFLIVSTVFPNGQHLRPTVFPRDNFLTDMVKKLYSIDTSTNLFPSIHVYNSIGSHIAIVKNETLRKKKWLKNSSFILCILIILSTIFLKQHSMFDVLTAIGLAVIMYPIAYKIDYAAWAARKRSAGEKEHAGA